MTRRGANGAGRDDSARVRSACTVCRVQHGNTPARPGRCDTARREHSARHNPVPHIQYGPNRETRHNAVRSDPNGTGLRSAVRKEKGRAGESRSHTRAREGAGNFSSRDGSAICARCPQLPGEEDAEDGNLRVVRTDGSGIPGTRRAAPEPAGTCRDQRYGRAIRRKARAASGTDNRNVRNKEI